MVLHFAVTIFAAFVGRHAEATYGSALGGVAQLGIATEISHDSYFVEGRHEDPFFPFLGLTDRRDTTSEKLKNQAIRKSGAINLN
jgi:hypothetical protein